MSWIRIAVAGIALCASASVATAQGTPGASSQGADRGMRGGRGQAMLFEGPERFRQPEPFPGAKWHWVFQVNPVQQTEAYGQIDERLHYTYGAIYTTPALGVMKAGTGGNYMQAFSDKDGTISTAARSIV